jgi:hypothetical protein
LRAGESRLTKWPSAGSLPIATHEPGMAASTQASLAWTQGIPDRGRDP